MSEYLMTATSFADKCVALAERYNTVYALGMWGWQLTRAAINAKARQLPSFYTASKKAQLYALADKGGYWGFDCVCMIKALLWGWDGSDSPRGGAVYASNGVPDFGADGIGRYCTEYTTDFSRVEVGEALHMPGHVGVYVGNGLAVECTAAWEGRVMVTAVGNIGKKAGYHTRTWTHHGKLKWVDYKEEDQPMTPAERAELEALKRVVASQGKTIDELIGRIADQDVKITELKRELDALNKQVWEQSGPLTVYHYWNEIQKELPWAYRPLRAMYDAGFFAGESAADLNVCRVKIECEVSLAAALKKMGEIDY